MQQHRYPFTPYPEGWFFVCHAHELREGKLFSRQFHGEEIVAYRDAQGEVRVFDAFCPHLGAHLGKTGALEPEGLKCRFHGFQFDGQGRCVRTGTGEPSRASSLRAYRSCESNGFVFAYHAVAHAVPVWSIPVLDAAGFNRPALRRLRVRSHPQEMAENGIDVAHFAAVHGFRELELLEPMRWQGSRLTCAYRLRVPSPFLERCGIALRIEFRLQKWGLGYSLAELSWPALGLSARQFVFPTPLDGEWVELNFAVCTRRTSPSWRRFALIENAARALLVRQFERELAKDVAFWESKRYLARPAIDASDGPIGEFRRFCRQFYPIPLNQLTPTTGMRALP
jgi:phenylpropionate dioxygenase-like ring-hydroxylating dioxygenase large terminal subunit